MLSLKKSHKRALATIGLLTVGLVGYQNCSPHQFNTEAPNTVEFLSTSGLTINNGAAYTKSAGVQLAIQAPMASEMYVTNDSSCTTGGTWESYKQDRAWTLGHTNTTTVVYVGFRSAKNGEALPCLQATITHDDMAPKVVITNKPGAFSKALVANYEFNGNDDGSGVDHLECQYGSTIWAKCDSPFKFDTATEGKKEFFIRAVDRAGNTSDPITDNFLVDRTLPTLNLTRTPSALSNISTAVFGFTAADAGAGIAHVHCQLNKNGVNGAVNDNCTSPYSINDLGLANTTVSYQFNVWAEDGAGNLSPVTTYSFVVNKQPSGNFEILGLTGGTDTTVDAYLGTTGTPTVSWTKSDGADSYAVAIVDAAGNNVVCSPVTVAKTNLSYAFSPSCSLSDGVKYNVQMIAYDTLGNQRNANLFPFRVDLTAPAVKITGPVLTNDNKNAAFTFAITDSSGIASATCTRKTQGGDPSSTVQVSCKDLTTMSYTNLALGTYTFQIAATDVAGNVGTSQLITWSVTQVVCDPFSSTGDGTCVKGLEANLYYLTGTQLQNPFTNVDDYINKGVKANVDIYMSQLFVPTTLFSKGFSTSSGNTLRANDGSTLLEYFALQLKTYVKLDPANDVAGKYQFAILSDDGSIVEYQQKGSTAWSTLIGNDGNHSTQLACDLTGISFTNDTRTALRIKYFQGPRYEIALTLLWRPMPTDASLVKDVDCGRADSNYWFGSPNNAQPDYTTSGYANLLKRGWKVLKPANYLSDVTATP